MKRVDFPAMILGALMLAAGLAMQPALAQQDGAPDREMEQMQAHMEKMRSEMTAIEEESDPEQRRRMLNVHMQHMHEAMGMMQREVMPALKRRMHTHKHAPGAASRSDTGEQFQSQQHMEKMEQMMSHMEVLIQQMSKHQAMIDAESEE